MCLEPRNLVTCFNIQEGIIHTRGIYELRRKNDYLYVILLRIYKTKHLLNLKRLCMFDWQGTTLLLLRNWKNVKNQISIFIFQFVSTPLTTTAKETAFFYLYNDRVHIKRTTLMRIDFVPPFCFLFNWFYAPRVLRQVSQI